jgi:hypothetical protein
MHTTKILPIKKEEGKYNIIRELDPVLPDVYKAQLLSIVAPIRSGKSVLWNNLLHRESMYKDLFDEICIISPTIANDASSRFTYKEFKHGCHEIYDDNIISNLVEKQKNKIENNQLASYCLILDDLCGQFSKSGRKGSAAIHFATRFRHYVRPNSGDPALVICSTQKYRDLHPILRCNSTGVLISGNIKSRKEIEAIVDDWADTFGSRKNFLELFKKVQRVPYAFLYLKLDAPGGVEAHLNFEKLLWKDKTFNKEKNEFNYSDISYENEDE